MKIFTIKNLFVALVAVCSFGVATAQESTTKLYIEPFTIDADEQKAIEIILDNPGDEFCQLQCDLYLPEGFTFPKNNRDRYIYSLNQDRNDEHAVSLNLQADGAMRVVVSNTSGYTFIGEEGAIVSITIKAPADIKEGEYELKMATMELARPDETNVRPADIIVPVTVTVPTGIEEVLGEDGAVKEAFDLQGRKVETLSKGIYVVNGKKVLVK